MLQSRLELWEQLGPATTEDEWEDFTIKLNALRDLIAMCQGNINHRISKYELKQFNRDYDTYRTRKTITV
jgi:hypothetical protein